jgi:hypothetical protein
MTKLTKTIKATKSALPAACLLALQLLLQPAALAHEGHDDSPAAVTSMAGLPQRLADGSIVLPKLSQRQLQIRTIVAVQSAAPQSIALTGKVIMDPNAGGKVQSAQGGRIAPGSKGLPSLGQWVHQGEVLALVQPAAGPFERANQAAQAAELRSNKRLAEQRVARLQQLEGSVPRKEIEAARNEVQSLTERLNVIGGSLSAAETLRAPVTGVIASANVVAGQVVEARELLFEIVDPNRLRIEALAYDAQLADNIGAAFASPAVGSALPLTFIGAGRMLREQAIPIQFRLATSAPAQAQAQTPAQAVAPLSLGQTVQVLVQTKRLINGIVLPATAIVRNAANQDMVWVHAEALRFIPKTVRTAALDGAHVVVQDGVLAGERVVVQGASLLNQVR